MTSGRPVARLVAPVLSRVMALVLLLAAIAIIGTVVATRAVGHLTDDLQPAAAATKDVLQDLSDMQAGVRAYVLAGQSGALDEQVARKRDQLLTVVRDRGIGIPPGEIDQLGPRFFRASNAVTNEIAGTGLGIRIVQTIIDKHAGELVIDSEEGEGTTVTIRLHTQSGPRSPAAPDEAAVAASAP